MENDQTVPAGSAAQAQAAGSSWTSFVKAIASFNGDLSSLTAPPFILSSTSLTEFSSYWCEHPALFVAPASEADPAKRALLVLKWFLTTLKQQYASRSEQYGNEKKPLNPFLGELFIGRWEDAGGEIGETELVSEQVSHHPPATAYSVTNAKHAVHLEGYNAQKATFSKTINIKQIGHAVLTLPVAGGKGEMETYLISLPSLHIEGLLFGSPFIELDGTSYIASSTGFTAKIDYSGKGWLSGKKNSVVASLHPTGRDKDVLYNVVGQWTKTFELHRGPAKHNSPATLVETYDAAAHPTTKLSVRPVDQQHPLESRRAWARVAAAIAKGDMETVGAEKSKIENAQRDVRAREKAEGREWDRRYFSDAAGVPANPGEERDPDEADGDVLDGVELKNDPVLDKLAAPAGIPVHGDADRTGGLWRFDLAKAKAAKQAPELGEEDKAKVAKELLGQ